jgi:hypothetical protein
MNQSSIRLSALFVLSAAMFALTLPVPEASAHYPYRPATPWYGARSVQVNQYNGWTRPYASYVTVLDRYGLSAYTKSLPYWPTASWNQSDNLHTNLVNEGTPGGNDTAIYIYPHDGRPPSATHIHLYSYGEADGILREDNSLYYGPAYWGDVHLSSNTVSLGEINTAIVISHEVGHALGLEDESHGDLMDSPNPGSATPSAGDRRTEEWCIPVFFYFPC